MMRVILKEDVPNLGVVGDLVSVKDGYARNYLIPKKKAVFASTRSVAELEHQKRLAARRRKQATAQADLDKQKIERLSVVMQAKVAPAPINEEGVAVIERLQKLFGSINNRDLAKVVHDSGVKVDHRRITLKTPVRSVGKFVAHVRLDGGVVAELPFWVVPEGAADLETEKKRVEAAQDALRREQEEAAQAEALLRAQERAAQVKAAQALATAAAEKIEEVASEPEGS